MNNASNNHEFSPKFKRKMKKLIRRRKKPYYKIINTVGKRVACITVILLVASSVTVMSVKALREAVANFFIDIYEKFSTVQPVDDVDAPETIEDIYGITYGLDDFEVVYKDISGRQYDITYVNGEQVINYSQFIIDSYNMNLNTEDAEILTIDINGDEAICYFDNNDYWNIIWNNGTYVIMISSNISKDVLIDMVKSVQKVE